MVYNLNETVCVDFHTLLASMHLESDIKMVKPNNLFEFCVFFMI